MKRQASSADSVAKSARAERRHWLAAGLLVGMAEIMPGISGGTVALLMGVYGRLLSALASFSPDRLLQLVRTRNWQPLDLGFLVVFGSAMLLGLWLLSYPLSWAYARYPLAVNVFLSLLVLSSLLPLLVQLPRRPLPWLAVVAGALLVFCGMSAVTWQLEASGGGLLLAGMGAGTLMLLPGVSGSYFLLMMGIYGDVLEAVRELDFSLLLPLAGGVVVGIAFTARLLSLLLQRGGQIVPAFLYGMVLGSLVKIAPQHVVFSIPLGVAMMGGVLVGIFLFRLAGRRALPVWLLMMLLLMPLAQAQPPERGGWLSYQIEKGENLDMIANLYGLKTKDLVRWNRLASPDRIFPGGNLIMPPGTVSRTHRVQDNETLSEIALTYRTAIKRLTRINGLASPNLIYPGQILRIAPELKPAVHRVRKGENLWGLALRYNIGLEELVFLNGLKEPSSIHPGQILRLGGVKSAAPVASAPRVQRRSTIAPPPVAPPAGKAVVVAPVAATTSWRWPADGKLTARFHPTRYKGIDIAGRRGAAVRAAADGVVRYVGDGLYRDYGLLIILGHGKYITVYGHNDTLLVKEGEKVKAGQTIARMGDTGATDTKLQFQVKYQSRPVDPLSLLPVRKKDRL